MPQCDRAIALGQSLAPTVGYQIVMIVAWRLDLEQRLQQAMDVGGVEEILTTGNEVHPLQVVIDHHGEMIARGGVLARKDRVAQKLGLGSNPAGTAVVPIQGTGQRQSLVDVEPPSEGLALAHPVLAFGSSDIAADTRIDEFGIGPVRGAAGLLRLDANLLARAEAGIDHSLILQPPQCRGVALHAGTLSQRLAVPLQP